jgi:hypothetical protein
MLWNSMVYQRFHKSPLPTKILSKKKPVHPSLFLRYIYYYPSIYAYGSLVLYM